MAGETDPTVALAVALAVRAVRGGSVCVDLTTVAARSGLEELPWPEPAAWLAAVAASPLAGTPSVLRLLDDRLLYLDRYWREEEQVCADLLARLAPFTLSEAETTSLETALDRVFPPLGTTSSVPRPGSRSARRPPCSPAVRAPARPRRSRRCWRCSRSRASRRERPRCGSRWPPPPARRRPGCSRRSQEEIAKLARRRPGPAARDHRGHPAPAARQPTRHLRRGSGTTVSNRLPHDVIVVDETSMVSLTMMARLLEAVRPETRLILVGDPDQLASRRGGGRAGRPGRGTGRPQRRTDRGAAHVAPLRGVDPRAGRGGAGRRCRPGRRPARGGRGAHRVRHRPRPGSATAQHPGPARVGGGA